MVLIYWIRVDQNSELLKNTMTGVMTYAGEGRSFDLRLIGSVDKYPNNAGESKDVI